MRSASICIGLAACEGTRLAIEAGAEELPFVVGYGADAVDAAREHIDGHFAVLTGDNRYEEAALPALFDAGPAIAASTVSDSSSYGVLSTE